MQDSESRGIMDAAGVRTFSLSGTANYQYSDRLTFTAGLGVISGETDGNGSTNSNIQRVGVNYNSDIFPVLEGAYRYFGQVSAGNRSNPGDLDESSVQDAGVSMGHSFNRTFVTGGGARWDLRLSQQGSTVHDTVGRERNALQHSISLTNGTRSDNVTRYLRLSVLDQRNFADERRDYQLANVQYTVQGQVSRNRSWNANASIQYGRRVQDKPIAQAMESASLSYSVTMSYRHADLFDMNNLTFTSDLRWLSEDFRTEDPFDPDYMLETERLNSSWRNRLEYRIGLLQMRGDVDLREVDSMWSLSVLLTVRRYFGMT